MAGAWCKHGKEAAFLESICLSGRVHLLDEVRGVSIILMVLYHALYDVTYIFGVYLPDWVLQGTGIIQPLIAGAFILISGIACRYSRSNLRRGCITLAFGCVVSLVTFVAMPDQMIWFGILHFLGTAMLLFALLHKVLDCLPPATGMLLCVAAFCLTRAVPRGWLGIPGGPGVALPDWSSPLLLPLGFGGKGSDYFPLLPWIFLFFAGAYLGQYVVSSRMPAFVYHSHAPRLAAVGRHTIVVYLLHQPVIYGLLWLWFRVLPT